MRVLPSNPTDQMARQILMSARLAARLTQGELAARLGRSQSYIGDIERGARHVDRVVFFAIARALGRNPADLISEILKVPSSPTVRTKTRRLASRDIRLCAQ